MKVFNRILSFIICILMIVPALAGCGEEAGPVSSRDTAKTEKPVSSVTDINVITDPEIVYETDPALEITEISVAGCAEIQDSLGKLIPWIEIYNRSDGSVKLSQYTITLTGYDKAFTLPDVTLGSMEYYVLLLDGNAVSGLKEVPSIGTLTLKHGEKVTFSGNYYNPNKDLSCALSTGAEMNPTPGYASVIEMNSIIINEIVASNGIYPINGKLVDWVELKNNGYNSVNLSDYYLSKSVKNLYAFRLPDVTLNSGELFVLSSENDLPFNISKDGDRLYLTKKGGIIASSVFTGPLEKNQAWTADLGVVDTPSPGYQNSREFCKKFFDRTTGLFISEVISNNMSYLVGGENYDMIEIENRTGSDVKLSDYRLSDKGSELERYTFPDVVLKNGECYTVLCGDASKGASFSVSSDGEKLYLSDKDGGIVDIFVVPHMPVDVSYGRGTNGTGFFKTPTFGKANSAETCSMTASPVADTEEGFHLGEVYVKLSGPGRIHYTTDGTKPTVKSPIYDGKVITLTKTSTVRAFSETDGEIPSDYVAFDFFIDAPDLKLPVVKISMNQSDFDGSGGIYTNYKNSKLEKEANASYYIDGVKQFSLSCGIKVFGNTSRALAKKSYSLRFRRMYGTSKLNYKLFDDLDIDSFNSIVLRSGSQNAENYLPFITDEFITSLCATSGKMNNLLVQAYRPVNLYINEYYMGIYYIRERISDDYIASHWNVDKSTVTVIQWVDWVKQGTSDQGWHALWKAVKNTDLSKTENYKAIADQIDLESFADLYIVRIWSGDIDADNIRVAKSPDYDGGKWHFILFDTDLCFAADSNMQTAFNRFMNKSSMATDNVMFRNFMKNAEFRDYFFTRLGELMKTALSPEEASKRIDYVYGQVVDDMPYNIDHWKNPDFRYYSSSYSYYRSMDAWNRQVSLLRKYAVDTRLGYMIKDLVKTFGFKAADVEKYFGEDYLKYMS